MNKDTEDMLRQYVSRAGQMNENFGFPRISGEIGALLYLKCGPMSLDDICKFLGIAKGSASTNARALTRMKFIRPLRIPGDRKDYYEFAGDLWPSLKEAFDSFVRNQVNDFRDLNANNIPELEMNRKTNEEDRLQRLHMAKQLKDLNSLYKYIEIIRKIANLFRENSFQSINRKMKKAFGFGG